MKLILLAASAFAAMVISCKKPRSDEHPLPPAETVVINGKTYQTVKLGTQIWTAVNYEGPGGTTFDSANSKPRYGKYYTYAEMKAIVPPAGWRIPSVEDYKLLIASGGVSLDQGVNSTEAMLKLASKTDWIYFTGSNATGFNAWPANFMAAGQPAQTGDNAEFWTDEGRTFAFMQNGNIRMQWKVFGKSTEPKDGFNIRFVK